MPRGVIDYEGLQSPELKKFTDQLPPQDLAFNITKIGHVVLRTEDIERAVKFYTQVLGFRVSEAYPDSMMKGKMVFMRCNNDHHGVALVGGASGQSPGLELHHMAFAVDTIDEVLLAREHLKKHKVEIVFEGRRRAGAQIAIEFRDPDGHLLEIYWGLDQVAPGESVRPAQQWSEQFSLEAAIDNPPPGQVTALIDRALYKSED